MNFVVLITVNKIVTQYFVSSIILIKLTVNKRHILYLLLNAFQS